MIYTDYGFYSQTWGGELTEAEFDSLAVRSQYVLDHITRHRLGVYWDSAAEDQKNAVRMAQCALIDQHLAVENSDKQVASESIGSHSVTYTATRSAQRRMRDIIRPYLDGLTVDGVSVMYRGLEERRCCRCT